MVVTPDRHTRWYQGIQRIYRNAVVKHLRTTLRDKYPQDWESILQKPFAKEWSTIVENADLPRRVGAINSALQDAADYLGVNHFYNLFDAHFELLFPEQGETNSEARKQEKAAVLGWAKEIKTVRDPESHPPSEDMDLHDVVRQLDTARRICSKFDTQAADELAALMSTLYSDRPTELGHDEKEASHHQPIQASLRSRLHAEALLLGPVQALGLTSRVEQAHRLASNAPTDAACLYAGIAEALRERFPGHADRFERLRATALRAAGDSEASHDLLMQLAIRDLCERAEPKLTPGVASSVEELHKQVDEVRQLRGRALIHFGRCHEYSGELEKLAECFDSLGAVDECAPVIAALFTEAALADGALQIVLDRNEILRKAAAGDNTQIGLRVHAALGDAGVPDFWPDLIGKAESLRFPSAEGTYVCLRGARWCAWNGQLDRAESLYRLAMKLGSESDLDLDVENALWSLTVLYSLRDLSADLFEELSEANRMALSIEGSCSYVRLNSRTQQRSYQYLANRQLPDAHLWAQYRLLESIRSGCLMDELESHRLLARIYGQSDEPFNALRHAVLGGSQPLVKELAPKIGEWPEFLGDMLVSRAPWVRKNALLALEYVGDLAPPELARELVPELLRQLREDSDDARIAPALLKALGTIVLEATDEDVGQLMPIIERAAVRKPETYRLTDPGVMTLAARLYRFRPNFRQWAASILGEMAIGAHTGEWSSALEGCGDDTGELIEAFEQVAERDNIDLARPLSDLRHLTAGTRALWLQRLQFVSDHPLGKRSGGPIGPRYDVPIEFLREQAPTVVHQYVDKLVAIGCDVDQPVLNRAAALAAAANVMDVVSTGQKRQVFGRVRPLAEQSIQISELDRYHANTQHPLSRFQISFGSETNARTSAGWLLARAATDLDECSAVMEIVLDWVRSDDSTLQGMGASILTLPNLSSGIARSSELANHSNPAVRGTAVWMPNMRECPETTTFEQLADDPDRNVRIAVAQALPSVASMDTEPYERIRARLNSDQSGIVRACASALRRRQQPQRSELKREQSHGHGAPETA